MHEFCNGRKGEVVVVGMEYQVCFSFFFIFSTTQYPCSEPLDPAGTIRIKSETGACTYCLPSDPNFRLYDLLLLGVLSAFKWTFTGLSSLRTA